MMGWCTNYRSKTVSDMYTGEPFGPEKLTMLGPILVGGAIFAAVDIGFGLTFPYRIILLTALMTPGAIWFVYLTYHIYKSLRLWAATKDQRD